MNKIIIGTRGSVLALWQAEYVKAELERAHEGLSVELKIVKTKGDKILDVPLAKVGGKGLFTKELEEMMLQGEIDLAVHSLKDVPVELIEGLTLSAITEREDVRDCFLSDKYASLETLPLGAKVGTTSLRRSMQIKSMRSDLDTESLRGNVQTRIKRLKEGDFDAIILAAAGVNRLDLWKEVNYVIPIDTEMMIPAMGQAALGIECKEGSEAFRLTQILEDEKARIETTAEREFVRVLEGGCQVPIGANAYLEGETLHLKVAVGLPDGSEILMDRLSAPKGEAVRLGRELAARLIAKGARELLRRAEEMAFQ
ncbi:MAG: hydroxymethylbilane synthase [Wolinella succinogenes]|uniref:hydroxymethylbilane synthase n=1 Tax=Wolinella succinogenes TaxID=844 RepID=UPI0016B27763|nr:hydroxymethylbilane synthase [Wolinella succinogenes]NLU33713.1 hydroxymethylbilane synthase [Wolinella succinogenes]